MPGKLVHTNEILVHLGDNWFTQRSAKQSVEITDRRIEKYNQFLNGIDKNEKQIVDWLNKIDELKNDNQQLIEIHEEYDEAAERKWREKHRENVRKQKEKERLEREAVKIDKQSNIENLEASFGLLSTTVSEREPVKESSSSTLSSCKSNQAGNKPMSKFRQQMLDKKK